MNEIPSSNMNFKFSGPCKTESLTNVMEAKTMMTKVEDHPRTNVTGVSMAKTVFTAQSHNLGRRLCVHVMGVLKKFNLPHVTYTLDGNVRTGLYIIHLETRCLREVPHSVFTRYCLLNNVKVMNSDTCCKIVYCKQPKAWRSQSLFSSVTGGLEKLISSLTTATNTVRIGLSLNFRLLLLDILALIIEVRDGLLTFGKFFSILLRLYTTYKRFDTMKPESLQTSDLILGFSLLGLPMTIIERMKSFTALTGQRIFDSDLMASLLSKFFVLDRKSVV